MKHSPLVVVAALLSMTCFRVDESAGAVRCAAPTTEGYCELSVAELEPLLSKANVFLFDSNLEDYYMKGHLPGATLLYGDDVSEKTLPADKKAMLVFYCKRY